MIRRVRGSRPAAASTGSSTAVRMASAMKAKINVGRSAISKPVQMMEAPNATKVSSRNISAEASP